MDQMRYGGANPNFIQGGQNQATEKVLLPYGISAVNFGTATELDFEGYLHVLLSKLLWIENLFQVPLDPDGVDVYGDGSSGFNKSLLVPAAGVCRVDVAITQQGSTSAIFGAPNITRFGHFAWADGEIFDFFGGSARVSNLQFINFPFQSFYLEPGNGWHQGFYFHLNHGVQAKFTYYTRNLNASVSSLSIASSSIPTITYGVNLFDGLPTQLVPA